jgi:hypothetical protein
MSVGSFHFDSCVLGKQTRSSFVSRTLASTSKLFDVIHCDVWEPAWVASISGYRYYIVFVNDFSRVSWLYLMKNCSSILDILALFVNEIHTQYKVFPKILRTNNALEFTQ